MKRFVSPFNFFFLESVILKHTSQITVKSLENFTGAAVPSHNLIRHVPYHNSTIECHDKVKSRSQVKISDAICSDEGLTLDTSALKHVTVANLHPCLKGAAPLIVSLETRSPLIRSRVQALRLP